MSENINEGAEDYLDTEFLSTKPDLPNDNESVPKNNLDIIVVYMPKYRDLFKDIDNVSNRKDDLNKIWTPIKDQKLVSKDQALAIQNQYKDLWPSTFTPNQLAKEPSKIGVKEILNVIEKADVRLQLQIDDRYTEIKKQVVPEHLEAVDKLQNGLLEKIIQDLEFVFEKLNMFKNSNHPNAVFFTDGANLTNIINSPLTTMRMESINFHNNKIGKSQITNFSIGLNTIISILKQLENNSILLDFIEEVNTKDNANIVVNVVTLTFRHLLNIACSNQWPIVLRTYCSEICKQIADTYNKDFITYTEMEANERGLSAFSELIIAIYKIAKSLLLCKDILMATM
jgi:hypothetical protein